MPHYLIQVGYNSDGVAALVRDPQDRVEKVRPAVEALGGSIEAGYYCFGEYDIVLVASLPDNVQAAAMALAVGAGGTVSSYTTTVLLTPEEAMQAMTKAADSLYQPASG